VKYLDACAFCLQVVYCNVVSNNEPPSFWAEESKNPMKQDDINLLRNSRVVAQGHWIAGRSVEGQGKPLDVVSPIDGKVFSSLANGSAADVNIAVAAARKAFEAGVWSKAAPAERKKKLSKFADLIEKHALELAVLGVRDNGTEIAMAYKAEPLSAAGTFRYYAEAIDKVFGEIAPTQSDVLALVHHEPLGVIGVIVPWNFPLMIGAWKVAPALAAGNSVVLKPPEIASLTLLRLAQLASEAGIPEGVFNVVTGKGASVGEAIGLHMDVDCLAFTGSGMVGRRLMEYSARSNLKRIYLELGGKSPNIVFNDVADIAKAAKVSAGGIFRNSGQVCVAGSRLLVQSGVYEPFMEQLVANAQKMKVGDPLDMTTEIGAVSSADQLKQDLGFVSSALSEGASLRLGGEQIRKDTGGYYMAPTIFESVKPSMRLFREEVFGPVLAVTKFETEAEAVALANGTDFGLASGVWTSNLSTAHRMIRAIRAGVVHVNTYGGSDITVPLGGFKQSGFGRDKSLHAIEKYCDLKTAWIQL
jgi:4-(gamma-glutamylamino)butanal dehydrogenase